MQIRREDRSFPRDSVRRRVWRPGLLWRVVGGEKRDVRGQALVRVGDYGPDTL